MTSSWKTHVAAALGTLQLIRVEKILWETPVTVSDQIIFEDNLANVLAVLTCDTANVSQCLDWTAKPKLWADFTLDQDFQRHRLPVLGIKFLLLPAREWRTSSKFS